MPVLPSFIPLYNKSKPKWKPKFNRTAFSPLISSPHPLPSPSILENTSSFGSVSTPGAGTAGAIPEPSAHPAPTPRIKLEFDLNEEPLDAWFQTQFLNDNDAPAPLQNGGRRKSAAVGAVFVERMDVNPDPEGWQDEDEADADGSATEDDALLEHIRALDVSLNDNTALLYGSNLIGKESTPFFGVGSSIEDQGALPAGASKRQPPPSPIVIPAHSMRNQVQLIRRSSDDPSSSNQSRPISILSDAESSAVSGRTLARALLANTFVLSSSSSDGRSSKYRSGIGGLVRTDSATLPRGEHPFLHSPHLRDRTLSGTSDTFSSNASEIPPIPANADKVYVPPQTLRNSGPDSSTTRRRNLRRYSSTGSLKTPDSKRSSKDSKTRSRPNSTIISASSLIDSSRGETMEGDSGEGAMSSESADAMDKEIRAIRRISRISEATTISSPTTPATVNAAPDGGLSPPAQEKGVSQAQQVLTLSSRSPPLPTSTGENPESIEAPGRPSDSLLLRDATGTERSSVTSSFERGASPEVAPSPRELDTVLDYYSFIDTSPTTSSSSSTPEPIDPPHRPFAPAFSPILEETGSQLSSPPGTSKSTRVTPILGGKNDFLPPQQRPSSQMSEDSIIPSSPAQITQVLNTGVSMRATLSPVTRRTSRVVGGRNRTGSTPSPIKVDRDSKDLNAYKITVSPLPEGILEETPSTASSGGSALGSTGGGRSQQTFPESPNMFSPMWTAASASSMIGMMQIQMQTHPEGVEMPSLPETPASAGLYDQQQLLLTRAATTAQKRPTRQGNLQRAGSSRALPRPQVQPGRTSTTGTVPATNVANASGGGDRQNQEKPNTLQTIDEIPAVIGQISSLSATSSPSKYSEQSPDLESAFAGVPFQFDPPTAADDDYAGNDTHPYARPALVEGSSRPSSTQPSPRPAHSPKENNIHASSRSSPSQSITQLHSSHSSPAQRPTPLVESTVVQHQSNDKPTSNTTSTLSTNKNDNSPPLPPLPPPVVVTPPATDAGIAIPPAVFSSHHHILSRISESSIAFESPPPYETIDQGQSAPSSGGTNVEAHFTLTNSTPPMHARSLSNDYLPSTRNILDGNVRDKRHRTRPMAPTGPRRPISSTHHPTTAGARNREASISSVASEATATNRASVPFVANARESAIPPPPPLPPAASNAVPLAQPAASSVSPVTPQFKVPKLPYRGMTMEQAKWTFTSSQLQDIVSRAIKQSAEASSIRLLRLEILENEIPPELKRLEIQKADIIAKYRSLCRSSEALVSRLGQQLHHHMNDMQTSVKLAGDLKEVTRQLQALAEELHCVDQHQSQIEILIERHHGSALSMALRKLNASFLKQMEQTQVLQDRVSELEDENWTLRTELNALKLSSKSVESQSQGHSQPQSPSQSHPGAEPSQVPSITTAELDQRRSTHSVIARRASQRNSRSTRLSANRSLSQRSSMSSNARSSLIGGISSTNSAFVVPPVPPVPPMPRRRPTDIVVNTTNRSTIFSQVISSDTGTANTELRTMLRLQDELYHTLGASLRGEHRLHRSYSVLGLSEPPQQQSSQPLATPALYQSPFKPILLNPHTLPPNTSSAIMTRPLSYPISLLDAYNHVDKERNDILATLEMFSHTD